MDGEANPQVANAFMIWTSLLFAPAGWCKQKSMPGGKWGEAMARGG
jgi:hypothetical protein